MADAESVVQRRVPRCCLLWPRGQRSPSLDPSYTGRAWSGPAASCSGDEVVPSMRGLQRHKCVSLEAWEMAFAQMYLLL